MEQPEGGGPNTYGRGKVAASRCPAPRDSPALSRQEGDDWPHTPFITLPLRRLPFPPSLSLPDLDEPTTAEPPPCAPLPFATLQSHPHTPLVPPL